MRDEILPDLTGTAEQVANQITRWVDPADRHKLSAEVMIAPAGTTSCATVRGETVGWLGTVLWGRDSRDIPGDLVTRQLYELVDRLTGVDPVDAFEPEPEPVKPAKPGFEPVPAEVTAIVGTMRGLLADGWVYDSTTPQSGGRIARVLLHPSGRQIEASTWPEGVTDLSLTGLSLGQVAGAIRGAGLVEPADDPGMSELLGAAVQLVAAWRTTGHDIGGAEAALASAVDRLRGEVVPAEYVREDPEDSAPLPAGVDGQSITGRVSEYVVTFAADADGTTVAPLTVLAPCSAQDLAEAIGAHLRADANTDYWDGDVIDVDLATGRATVTTRAGWTIVEATVTGPGVTR